MENSIIDKVSETFNNSLFQENLNANVGTTERAISVGAGAFITIKGITNLFSSPLLALTELGLGGALLYRGITGYCPVKEKLDQQELQSNQAASKSTQPVPTTAIPTESY